MQAGISLGHIAGIELRIHWTWLLAAASVSVVLGGAVFPDEVPGLSNNTYFAMGVATALLFFGSLLLHELGHALEARREGIATRAITLWMLGGVAEIEAPLPTPGAEARVGLAGPAVSAALGAPLVAAGSLAALPAAPAAMLEWLGWTNLLLVAFNLLPALPLDGGRVLRAALWRLRRSYLEGTRAAARVSEVVAVAMIAVGAVGVLAVGAFGGLWLGFIGAFVFSAARAERAAAEAQAALAGVRVAEVMTPDPITIPAAADARDLLELARRTGHATYLVVDDDGGLIGLASVVAAERLPAHRRPWVRVRDLMTDVPALDADAEVLSVVDALASTPIHRAAVLQAGRLVGLVSLGDVIRAVQVRTRSA